MVIWEFAICEIAMSDKVKGHIADFARYPQPRVGKHPNTDLRIMLTRGKGWKEGDYFVGNVAKTLKIKHVPPSKK